MSKFKVVDFDQFEQDVPNRKSNYMRMVSHIKTLNETIKAITLERDDLREKVDVLESQFQDNPSNVQKDTVNASQNQQVQPLLAPQESNIKGLGDQSLQLQKKLSLGNDHMSFAGGQNDQQSKTPTNATLLQSSFIQQSATAQLLTTDDRDEKIFQLNQIIEQKERDLVLASNAQEECLALKQSYKLLEERNSELLMQLGEQKKNQMYTQGPDQSTQLQKMQDQLNKLNQQNQFYCSQYEEIKKKLETQETTMEYLVAENSRLIIKSFTYSQRNLNNIL